MILPIRFIINLVKYKYLIILEKSMNEKIIAKLEEHNINVSDTLKRLSNNEDLYITLLKSFLNDTNIDLLIKAYKDVDYEKIIQSVHSLKGIAANLGFTSLYNNSALLVSTLRNKDYSDIDNLYTNLIKSYEDVIHTIEDIKE